MTRIWVRDHRGSGWITVFWTQLHRVAAPFGELAWDHARKAMPAATETELADAVEDLLSRAGHGPAGTGTPGPELSKQDRRVAARTRAVNPAASQANPEPEPEASETPGEEEPAAGDAGEPAVVPMPIFDPFREAEKWR